MDLSGARANKRRKMRKIHGGMGALLCKKCGDCNANDIYSCAIYGALVLTFWNHFCIIIVR